MATYSGKNCRVLLGSVALRGTKWSVTDRVEEIDISHFHAPYVTSTFPGLKDGDVSVEALWEHGLHAGSPPPLKAGSYTDLRIFPDRVNLGGSYWHFNRVFLVSVLVDAEVRGLVKYTLAGKNSGLNFYYPGNISAI